MALTKVTGSVLGDTDSTDIDYTNSGTGAVERTLQSKLEETVSVVDFGADPTGLTDSASSFNAMIAALSNGDTVHITSGTYLLGSGIDFTQDDLTIYCDQGTEFYQADSTQNIDSLITVSGDRVTWVGGKISANITGNPDIDTSTGRGESMRWSGNYGTGKNIYFNQSHAVTVGASDTGVAAGLHVRGVKTVFDNIYCYDCRNSGVRDHGDFNTFLNLRFNEFVNKGFVKDSGVGGAASTYTYVHIAYAYSSSATDLEAVLFDHDGVQAESCEVQFGYVDTPNMTGPDQFKFAYVKNVIVRGYRGAHSVVPAYRNTIRFQQETEHVVIDDCIFPGAVNIDASTECNMLIKGNSVIGNTIPTPAAIQDFAGTLTIEDGVTLKNLQTYAITTDTNYPDSIINLGRPHYDGCVNPAWAGSTAYTVGNIVYNDTAKVYVCVTAGTSASSGGPTGTGSSISDNTCVWDYVEANTSYTPAVINHTGVLGTARRMVAGNISVGEALSTTGGMKNIVTNGRWISLGEIQEVGCAQTGASRVFLAGGDDFTPREIEGIRRGDIIRKRLPAAGDSVAEYWCTTAGAACTTLWTTGDPYSVNDWVYYGTEVYVCTSGGNAGATAPTGTGDDIDDGTCIWNHVDTLAVFKAVGSIAS